MPYMLRTKYLILMDLIDWITKHHAQNIAETMKAQKPWIEESREFFGLVILIVVLLINYFYAKKKMHKTAASGNITTYI